MDKTSRILFRPLTMAELEGAEQWLDDMLLEGWRPLRLTLGCIWRFVPTSERTSRWYLDVKSSRQSLYGDTLAPLLEKLGTVFYIEKTATRATFKRAARLEAKPNPNFRLEQFAVEEGLYRYKGARIVQHMTPERMLELIKRKRDEGLLKLCRFWFIVFLLAFVLCCALMVWRWGMGWHLLASLPLWAAMLHFAISFVKLGSKLKKRNR